MPKKLLDDRELAIPLLSPVCSLCKHLDIEQPLLRRCRAFKSIPMVIWMGKNDHKKAYPGDHGIKFEKVKK